MKNNNCIVIIIGYFGDMSKKTENDQKDFYDGKKY